MGLAVLALALGFLLVQLPVLRHFFDLIAQFLAAVAATVLGLMGHDVLRNGVELRDAVTGHAIAVSSACDGHGLLISTAAVILWLGARAKGAALWAKAALVIALTILLFNLVRILLLFLSLGALEVAHVEHLYVAPLLSMPLVAGLALYATGLPATAVIRSLTLWALLAFAFAVLWYFAARPATCYLAVPVANALIDLLPGRLTQAISCAGADATILTTAVQTADPLTVMTLSFDPTDFTLATPLVLAALALGRRHARIIAGLFISLGLFSLAMVVGATTMSHDAATAAGLTMLTGSSFMQSYTPPGEFLLALLKAAQNTLVHFNLFLLPLVMAYWTGAAAAPAAPTTPRPATPPRRPHRK